MALNIAVAWDFSNLVLDDVYINSYSYGAGGGGGGGSPAIVDAPPVNSPAVLNNVTIAIPPALPAPGDPTPTVEAVTASNSQSVAIYGEQATPAILTLLSSIQAAEVLALYLGRAQPVYWYSNLVLDMARLSSAQQDAIAELDLGDQIRVSKRFNGVTNPVIQTLFVEGIEHEITPRGHTVILHTSPADLYTDFILGTSALDDVLYGLG
jgi:hypothetical protein